MLNQITRLEQNGGIMNKLSGKTAEKFNKAVEQSRCNVKSSLDDSGQLIALCIELAGDLAQIPSKSNSKEIGRKRVGNKLIPIIRNSDSVIARCEALKQVYVARCLDQGDPLRSFGDRQVHVQVWLADAKGRWDSHNTTKAIGDFLEDAGIVNNDSNATIWADKTRRPEYSEITRILIIDQNFVAKATVFFKYQLGMVINECS